MILIADSGATKTLWALLQNSGDLLGTYTTIGFSPLFHERADILPVLEQQAVLKQYAAQIQDIYYFGTGCSTPARCQKMETIFQEFFPKAGIHISTDMYAVAIATCFDEAGISCILGTGANSCYYNGNTLHEATPSLGYVLGDEGAGSYLGRNLIRHYLYQRLPKELHDSLAAQHEITKEIVLHQLYKTTHPKKYLASFTHFLGQHKTHPYVQEMLYQGFSEFLEYHVCIYPNHQKLPIHFSGSVAFYFQEMLQKALANKQLQKGKIIRNPVQELVRYYQQKIKNKLLEL